MSTAHLIVSARLLPVKPVNTPITAVSYLSGKPYTGPWDDLNCTPPAGVGARINRPSRPIAQAHQPGTTSFPLPIS